MLIVYALRRFFLLGGVVVFVLLLLVVQIKAALPPRYILPVTVVLIAAVSIFAILARDFFYVYFKRSIGAVGLLCIVATLSMVALLQSRNDDLHFDWASAGSVLVLFTAVVTVTGFTITITRLQEYHVRIATYDEFLLRLESFLSTACLMGTDATGPIGWCNRQVGKHWHKRRNDNEGIKILCSVPTLGNMSHHPFFYRYVHPRWKQLADSNVQVDMVCINPEVDWNEFSKPPMIDDEISYNLSNFTSSNQNYTAWDGLRTTNYVGKFYESEFRVKRNYQNPEVLRGIIQAIEIIWRIKNERPTRHNVKYYPWPPATGEPPPMHLFWTHDRALVAFPLDRGVKVLPSLSSVSPVELVGYETTDPRIIQRLREVFEEWKRQL